MMFGKVCTDLSTDFVDKLIEAFFAYIAQQPLPAKEFNHSRKKALTNGSKVLR